ncbi:MAG: amino acid-binding protein, partial [Tissierellia bacterium]|nr:amino acid-binding protein [Tissierellia bacterium]
MIKQISILVENEIGTIFEVTDILAQNNINIKAFSV